MDSEWENLLNRLDELMMEAHEKGYSFVFDNFDDTTNTVTTLYSASETFGIDIIEWDSHKINLTTASISDIINS